MHPLLRRQRDAAAQLVEQGAEPPDLSPPALDCAGTTGGGPSLRMSVTAVASSNRRARQARRTH
jgi:hypothetical protein